MALSAPVGWTLAPFDRARRALISRVDALGELYTRNWDKEPLPVLYDADARRPSHGDYVRTWLAAGNLPHAWMYVCMVACVRAWFVCAGQTHKIPKEAVPPRAERSREKSSLERGGEQLPASEQRFSPSRGADQNLKERESLKMAANVRAALRGSVVWVSCAQLSAMCARVSVCAKLDLLCGCAHVHACVRASACACVVCVCACVCECVRVLCARKPRVTVQPMRGIRLRNVPRPRRRRRMLRRVFRTMARWEHSRAAPRGRSC